MGTIRHIVLAALVATTPVMVLAQESSAPPPLQDFRLDPSRDPNRPRAPERAGPEIGQQTTTTPAPEAPPPVTATVAPPVVAPTVTTPRATTTTARRAAEPTPQVPVPAPTQEAAPVVETAPIETAPTNATEAPAVTETPEVATDTSSVLPWVAGGVILALLAGFVFWRRSNGKIEEPEAVAVMASPSPVPPVQRAKAVPPPPPVRTPPPPPPAFLPPVLAASSIALEFLPTQVRTSMVGAQVGYRLTLRNGSGESLDGLAVAAFMANADAQHTQSLAAFFDDAFAPEAHRIAQLASGAEIAVDGELRLDRIAPIEVEGRALLIPVIAFKVISLDGDELARGAFIVGQESTPPRAKMGPFRMDQGPRQFRTVGSRPAQVMIPA